MSELTYEASVYSRTVKYRNFNGKDQVANLYFALDPLKLMRLIASFNVKPNKKSNNPAVKNQPGEITDDQQLKFIQDLANEAAGWPSEDGESWETNTEFQESIAGKAFMTRLASSDADRREFAEKVILDPFRAFVAFAKEDPTNSPKEVAQFDKMLGDMERLFLGAVDKNESLEDRKARLAAELASLGTSDE